MPAVAEQTEDLDGQPAYWRSAPSPSGNPAPVLYLHGVPSSSDEWPAFLERTGGLAPDLPGFGRSGKRGDLDFSIGGYDAWIDRFLDHVGAERVRLVVHDWGAVGLVWAQRHPERVERVVVMNAVPLLPGYRWHRVARIWRTRLLGELFQGFVNRPTLNVMTRGSNVARGPLPRAWRDSVLAHFDQGTQRAILHLYRSSPPEVLAAAGAHLGDLTCPALVAWGTQDPYIPAGFADAYAQALGGRTQLLLLEDAGHWPWLDRPDLVGQVAAFLEAGP